LTKRFGRPCRRLGLGKAGVLPPGSDGLGLAAAAAAAATPNDSGGEIECVICDELLTAAPCEALRYGHTFHSNCIRQWGVSCPMCRDFDARCPNCGKSFARAAAGGHAVLLAAIMKHWRDKHAPAELVRRPAACGQLLSLMRGLDGILLVCMICLQRVHIHAQRVHIHVCA